MRDEVRYDWNEDAEDEYKEADKFKSESKHSSRPGNPGWPIPQYEKGLHDRCSRLYESEYRVYDLFLRPNLKKESCLQPLPYSMDPVTIVYTNIILKYRVF